MQMSYLCTRKKAMVPWMSGLVNGLQNRLRRFESARHLHKTEQFSIRGTALVLWSLLNSGSIRRWRVPWLLQIESATMAFDLQALKPDLSRIVIHRSKHYI